MKSPYSLPQLGWNHFFQQQLSLEEYETCTPARVFGQERSVLQVINEHGALSLPVTAAMEPMTVGDWVLLDRADRFHRTLDRSSLFFRKAVGAKNRRQLISANVDTVFLVSSMNQDFNLNRLERYLALTSETDVESVIVLTKADCCETPQEYISRGQALGESLAVLGVNSLDRTSVKQLNSWCQPTKTVAFLGSSGVGKSTLVNTLLGETVQRTQSIRQDDDKGRHTTSSRSMHLLPSDVFSELAVMGPPFSQCRTVECLFLHELAIAKQPSLLYLSAINGFSHSTTRLVLMAAV